MYAPCGKIVCIKVFVWTVVVHIERVGVVVLVVGVQSKRLPAPGERLVAQGILGVCPQQVSRTRREGAAAGRLAEGGGVRASSSLHGVIHEYVRQYFLLSLPAPPAGVKSLAGERVRRSG